MQRIALLKENPIPDKNNIKFYTISTMFNDNKTWCLKKNELKIQKMSERAKMKSMFSVKLDIKKLDFVKTLWPKELGHQVAE